MSNAVLEQSTWSALCADNAYLPRKNELYALQQKKIEQFLQRGFPTRREECWKYTDVSSLEKKEWSWAANNAVVTQIKKPFAITLVFVNGHFSAKHSNLSALPDGVYLGPLSQALETKEDFLQSFLHQDWDIKRYPFANFNTALMTDGVCLFVPKNRSVTMPIHCLFLNTGKNNFITCPRNIIVAEQNSQVTLIEEYISYDAENYFTNTLTTIQAEENAQVRYFKIQAESASATHIASVFSQQKQHSVVKSFSLPLGARLAREDIHVFLRERSAECHLNGLYHLNVDNQHIDNYLHVDHMAEHSISSMLYKGILDKKSRAVFNGKVFVHQGAQKVNAQQTNHNLLLSHDAEVDTKPELEVYADDVKCTHGATIGQVDPESLFYLRARGIEKNEALALLAQAFFVDVLNTIDDASIKRYIEQQVGRYDN